MRSRVPAYPPLPDTNRDAAKLRSGELSPLSPPQQTRTLRGCLGEHWGPQGRGWGEDDIMHSLSTMERFQSHCTRPWLGTRRSKGDPTVAPFSPTSASRPRCPDAGETRALAQVARKAAAAGHDGPTLLHAKSSRAPLSAVNSTQSCCRRRWDGCQCPTSTERGRALSLPGTEPLSAVEPRSGGPRTSHCRLQERFNVPPGPARDPSKAPPMPHRGFGLRHHRLTSQTSLQLSELIEETQPRQTPRRENGAD